MCSPAVSKCDISYNKYFGMVISGHDAMPQLISTEDQIPILKEANCTFEKNAYVSNGSIFRSSHIGIVPTGNIYMRDNDIYSSPSFPAISIAQIGIRDQHITVDVQRNFWGYPEIEDDHFVGHTDYTIDYSNFYPGPCGTFDISPDIMQSISEESRILSNALSLETKDKIVPAIKLYEHIIKKYVDTPEYYVAMARLPYLYEKAELDNNVLITMYDEAIESENTSHKKFFKGRKVATHIKGRRFDKAISIAEEMKEEADNDEEIILADINIGIANMLKDLENNGKSRTDNSQNVRDLIAKLDVTEGEGEEKTDIVESALPTEFTLYQNYPNPFNPTTEISYALSQDANVSIKVYSSNGSVVADLVNASQSVGQHSVTFDASKLSNGIFYYSLVANGRVVSTKKMLLLK
ncbi:MAG: T9SS type A sorting domain-containing protein [Candidatus Delongbacteria bacterium]|nr:T9SS type A sorting domain-containing protein [Candidatus Delongbacteria bacterium]